MRFSTRGRSIFLRRLRGRHRHALWRWTMDTSVTKSRVNRKYYTGRTRTGLVWSARNCKTYFNIPRTKKNPPFQLLFPRSVSSVFAFFDFHGSRVYRCSCRKTVRSFDADFRGTSRPVRARLRCRPRFGRAEVGVGGGGGGAGVCRRRVRRRARA